MNEFPPVTFASDEEYVSTPSQEEAFSPSPIPAPILEAEQKRNRRNKVALTFSIIAFCSIFLWILIICVVRD
jgi:hypothetical protein